MRFNWFLRIVCVLFLRRLRSADWNLHTTVFGSRGQSLWYVNVVIDDRIQADTSQTGISQQNEKRWFPMILFIVRDNGSFVFLTKSQLPKHFILRKLEPFADLKKFLSETFLPSPRKLAHSGHTS